MQFPKNHKDVRPGVHRKSFYPWTALASPDNKQHAGYWEPIKLSRTETKTSAMQEHIFLQCFLDRECLLSAKTDSSEERRQRRRRQSLRGKNFSAKETRTYYRHFGYISWFGSDWKGRKCKKCHRRRHHRNSNSSSEPEACFGRRTLSKSLPVAPSGWRLGAESEIVEEIFRSWRP